MTHTHTHTPFPTQSCSLPPLTLLLPSNPTNPPFHLQKPPPIAFDNKNQSCNLKSKVEIAINTNVTS